MILSIATQQIIQINISLLADKGLNSFIWYIDVTLTDTTFSSQRARESTGNKGVLPILLRSWTETSPKFRAICRTFANGGLLLCWDAVGVFYDCHQLGCHSWWIFSNIWIGIRWISHLMTKPRWKLSFLKLTPKSKLEKEAPVSNLCRVKEWHKCIQMYITRTEWPTTLSILSHLAYFLKSWISYQSNYSVWFLCFIAYLSSIVKAILAEEE